MLRVILKRTIYDAHSGMRTEGFSTVDIYSPEVEEKLKAGGFGPDGFDETQLIGVEVLPEVAA